MHNSHKNIDGCVATIGFFDGVHRGHRFLLQCLKSEAQRRGLQSLVITFPESPSSVLSPSTLPPLLSTADEKRQLLLSSGIDDVAMLDFTQALSSMTVERFMSDVLACRFGVRVLLMGYDHRFGSDGGGSFPVYEQAGKKTGIEILRTMEYKQSESSKTNVSSSSIRNALLSGDIRSANNALGYYYSIEGRVVGGHHVGTVLGYPTANLRAEKRKLIPANGVYAVRVVVDGNEFGGMLNIGRRPTLDNGHDISVEVNIFDFNENIYSENIRVEFVARLREERRFESIDSLRHQLKADEAACRQLLKK